MDYLDTKKDFRQHVILMIGYVLVSLAIVISTMVLVYQAYGFDLGKNGTVIQNGLVFFSSQPSPASIYLNGTLRPEKTNTRLILPSGVYHVRLSRAGYQSWQRQVVINGGSVEHFDYPLLLPTTLTSKKVQAYSSAPTLATQSPDKRWLLVGVPTNLANFDLYDLKDPKKPVLTSFSLPANVLTKAASSEAWQVGEWADDNQHVLLEHDFDGKTEFILVDHTTPSQSLNLNSSLATSPTKLSLINKKYDQYYIFNAADSSLEQASLSTAGLTPLINHVLAYTAYGSDTLLYVSNQDAPTGKVVVRLKIGSNIYDIHNLPLSPNYLVNMATYSDTPYVATGATADNRVYIYQDPVAQLAAAPNQMPVPSWVLHVPQPNYLSFSSNAQFIMAQSGNHYGVYDIENKTGYNYSNSQLPLDAPQPHAAWMDGDRLTYISNRKMIIEDYDNTNIETLNNAAPQFTPLFSSDYKYVFTFLNVNNQYELNQTALLAPADL